MAPSTAETTTATAVTATKSSDTNHNDNTSNNANNASTSSASNSNGDNSHTATSPTMSTGDDASSERFTTPGECSETLLLDTSNPQILGAIDNILATSPAPSPRAQRQDEHRQKRSVPPSPSPESPHALVDCLSTSASSENDGNKWSSRSRSTSSGSSSDDDTRSVRSDSDSDQRRDAGRRSSSSALDRIEYVEVAKKIRRGGASYYVVDVYEHRCEHARRASASAYSTSVTSRLSGADVRELMLSEREPEYHVERCFAAFRELRSALQHAATECPAECSHCRTLLAFVTRGANQAWTLKRLVKSSARRREQLAAFVNGALSLASGAPADARGGSACAARDEAVALVERFLRRRYEGSLGII